MFNFFSYYYKDYNHVIYHLIIIIGILVGIINFNKLKLSGKFILLLLILTLIAEFTSYSIGILYNKKVFVYNIYNIIQCSLICSIYYFETKRKIILFLFSFYLCSVFINGIYVQPFTKIGNTNTLLIENLFIIIWVFLYFVSELKKIEISHILYNPISWISLGWLVFCIISIISFGFAYLSKNFDKWDNSIFVSRHISNYLLYLSFIPAFLCKQKSLNDNY